MITMFAYVGQGDVKDVGPWRPASNYVWASLIEPYKSSRTMCQVWSLAVLNSMRSAYISAVLSAKLAAYTRNVT